MPQFSRAKTSAFTLTELLVVIAIVAALIAVLMPALGRAREQANRVRCAANLHSMGQALLMYTQQHGAYPACELYGMGGMGRWALWPIRLRSLLGNARGVFYCPSQDPRCEWTLGAAPGAPVATAEFAPFGYELGEPLLAFESAPFSYGYNWGGTSPGAVPPPDGRFRGLGALVYLRPLTPPALVPRELKAPAVRRPSEMIAVTDSTSDGYFDFIAVPLRPGYERHWPGKLHGGGANVLFCDGHVQWSLQKDLLVSDTFVPAEAPIRRMWNNNHEPNF